MNTQRITPLQLTCLCFAFLSGFSTQYLLEAKMIMQDVWMANELAVCWVLVILKINTYIQNQYPHRNMTEIIEALYGKWIGKLVLGYNTITMVGLGTLSLRSISLFYTTAILPNTSPKLIMLLVLIVTTYAASLGLSAIARSVLVILPFFAVAILVICVSIYRNVDINPFMPQFRHGIPIMVFGTMMSYGFPFGKSVVMSYLFSEVAEQKKLFKACSIAVVMSCAYLLLATYLSMGSLGENLFKAATFPFFSAIQLVKFGEYIERIEITIIAIWTILTMYEVITVQYVFVKITGRIFGLKTLKPLYIPAGAFIFGVAVNSLPNPAALVAYDTRMLPVVSLGSACLLPLCNLGMTLIRKRKAPVPQT
ncbi:endospore germination permease [Paenibacillus sp. MWE-103]|uniref:Endospore germination permease n=1 Tax=Paenibacillus artemisiicola TaxID=1172618 RepID=A0ABS3W3X2_9BACL|nr:endospore germination permease [Paenibacillus artemisiicola]